MKYRRKLRYIKKSIGFTSLTLLLLVACDDKKVVITPPYDGPLGVVKDVQTLFSDSAIVRIKLEAPLQYQLINEDREFPDGFQLFFLNKEEKTETKLTADYGKYLSKKEIYIAKGNVVIQNIKTNEQLDSEELIWNPKTEKIYTDKFVRIRTKDEILMGNGLDAKQDFSEYKILKPTGIFSVKQ